MIAVIADDLAGAAEVASAAAQRGLRSEVHTAFDASSQADVIAVDSNTRSRPPADAALIVSEIARLISQSQPAWFYKKTDSILRGNVRVEIEAILNASGKRRCLFAPANPTKGRTIRAGHYFIGETPLAESPLASDPEHPIRSSDVRELLGPSPIIETPDVPDRAALKSLAAKMDAGALPAGGVEFFEALLDARGMTATSASAFQAPVGSSLFVCGSAAAWRLGRAAECRGRNIPIFLMPGNLTTHPDDPSVMAAWSQEISAELGRTNGVMCAIGRSEVLPGTDPSTLIAALARAATIVMTQTPVARVLVEGGATAAALFHLQKWTKFLALPSTAPGVAVLSPLTDGERATPLLFVKPGSYPWPEEIWL